MSDWSLLIVALLALLGGVGIAYATCRHRPNCPFTAPYLEPDTRVEFKVGNQRFTTLLHSVEGETLWLVPPLRNGLPLSFPQGTAGTLTVALPSGIYSASFQFTERRTRPRSLLGIRLSSAYKHTQRRRDERIPLPDEAQVEILTPQDCWIGWVQDVSRGGMRLVCPVGFPTGASLALLLPSTLAKSDSAERRARVVACERAVHRASYAYIVRLAYIDGSNRA